MPGAVQCACKVSREYGAIHNDVSTPQQATQVSDQEQRKNENNEQAITEQRELV